MKLLQEDDYDQTVPFVLQQHGRQFYLEQFDFYQQLLNML